MAPESEDEKLEFKELNKLITSLNAGNNKLNNALTKLTASLDINITAKFITSMKQFDQTQRVALGMNQSLTSIIGENTGALQDLPGGYQDAVETQVLAFRSGFKGYNESLTALGVRMKITGQGFEQFFTVMAQLRVAGLLDEKATTRLSDHLVETTKKYGISTDILVGAMSNLGDTLQTTAALGITENVVKAQTSLVAMLGMGSEGNIKAIIQGITQANIGADVMASIAGPGVQEFRYGMLDGLDDDRLVQIMESIHNTLGEHQRAFVGYGESLDDTAFMRLELWKKMYGENNLALVQVAKKITERTDQEKETYKQTVALNNSLQVLKDELWDPLLKLGVDTLGILTKNVPVTKALLVALGVLTIAIKFQTAMAAKQVAIKAGNYVPGFLGRLNPWAVGAAVTVGLATFGYQMHKQTSLLKATKTATEQSARIAKTQEERELSSSSRFASMTSETLRTVLQMHALMPELSTAIANNMNQLQTDKIIKLLQRNNTILLNYTNEMVN